MQTVSEIGKKEESPLPEIFEKFERQDARFKALMAQDHDLLGRVLKRHLVVEHYLDRFLASHYGIGELGAAKLTFHQNAKRLPNRASLSAVVKSRVIRLNAIRKQFGHTLGPLLSFNDLAP